MTLNNLQSINSDNENDVLKKLTNFDAEIAIIGCLLWDNRSYEKVADFLTDDHFTDINNKKIFFSIKKLLDKNILVSPITLKNYLDEDSENEMDNFTYLNQIKDSAPSTQNAYQYAKLITSRKCRKKTFSFW